MKARGAWTYNDGVENLTPYRIHRTRRTSSPVFLPPQASGFNTTGELFC